MTFAIPNSKTVEFINKYLDFFVDLVLQEYEFQKYPAKDLAIAIIIAAWKGSKIYPIWNPELE